MKHKIIYSSSLSLPECFFSSSFLRAPENTVGVAIAWENEWKGGRPSHSCLLLNYDINTDQVSYYHTYVSCYYRFFGIHFLYHVHQKQWLLVFDADAYTPDNHTTSVIDMYAIPNEDLKQWDLIQRIPQAEVTSEYRAVALLPEQQNASLLAEQFTVGSCDATDVYLERWRPSHLVEKEMDDTIEIQRGFRYSCVAFDDSFLLFTCECPKKTLKWRFRIGAYWLDGTERRSKVLPAVFYPCLSAPYIEDDIVLDWLWPVMEALPGPIYQEDNQHTAIAVLVLHNRPEKIRRTNSRLHAEDLKKIPTCKGGFYWIHEDGRILQKETSEIGDELSFCVCGKQVIGTDVLAGKRRLWCWFPLEGTPRVIKAVFSSEVKRVLVVAANDQQEEAISHFWCVEEYEHGLNITFRSTTTYQVVDEGWVEGLKLSSTKYPFVRKQNTPDGSAFGTTLLLVCLNQKKQLHLLHLCCESGKP